MANTEQADRPDSPIENEGLWHQIFAVGHPVLARKQRRYGLLPDTPRCRLCWAPFAGWGGRLMRLRGLRSSERNPNFCNRCDRFLHSFSGGAEVPMSMLMTDIRGSVALSSGLSPAEYAGRVVRLRHQIHEVLVRTDAFVLEYQGDSVFAVWPPGFVGPNHATRAFDAARLLAGLRPDGLSFGAAVHCGPVFLGTVPDAGGRMHGIAAFGLNVNILGRLCHAAPPGGVLVTGATCVAAGQPPPGAKIPGYIRGIDDEIALYAIAPDNSPAAAV